MQRLSCFLMVCFPLVLVAPGCGGKEATPPPVEPDNTPTRAAKPAPSKVKPTAAPSTTIKTLFIRESLADCEGTTPMKCMQVREDPQGEWTYLYDKIAGFEYEESYRYELRVEVEEITDPPADGASRRLRLVEQVSKEKVTAEPKPQSP